MRVLLPVLSACFAASLQAAGTWTALANNAPYNYGAQMNLLSDGTVMIHVANGGDSYGNGWARLTPDIHGSYINGTFSTLAAMHDTRLDMSSQVLKDGRLYVAGGEYGTGTSTGEVYDPLSNTWTQAPSPGAVVSDACSALLDDGRVLQSLVGTSRSTVFYNPANNTYATGPSTQGSFAEAAWVKLPDHSILQVDHATTASTNKSERYIPAQNKWVADAAVPVNLYDPYGGETGAGFLLPNGKAFFLGSSGTTAIYTPSGSTAAGSWIAGPMIPNAQGTPDAPAAMMVNGKILCMVSPIPTADTHFPMPVSFYEYDYVANAFTQVNAPTGGLTLNNVASYYGNMLALPDGRILWGRQGSRTLYVYTPDGTALAAGKPAIQKISSNPDGSYRITGTQFNGISEGAAYGDDEQMATNYPIIRLTLGNNAYYARTFNWNSAGVMRGNAPDTATFTLPNGLSPTSSYSLVVTANGIASDPVPFTPGPAAALAEHGGFANVNVRRVGPYLSLHLQEGAPGATLRLIRADGQTVYRERIAEPGQVDREIDLGAHGQGLYWLILDNAEGRASKPIAFE